MIQYQIWFGAFLQGLTQSGWNIGQNVRIDTRRATASADAVRKNAAELVALAPDVIFAVGASTVGPLVLVTRTVPIVFASVADPVGAGFVDGLAQPGRNVTGFMAFEYGISREMVGIPQADHAKPDANRGASRCRHSHRYRSVASGLAFIHRDLIIELAAERRLPAIYFDRTFVTAGGLVSYGPNEAASAGEPLVMSTASNDPKPTCGPKVCCSATLSH